MQAAILSGAIVAVFISCIGLFGLSVLSAIQTPSNRQAILSDFFLLPPKKAFEV